MSRRGGARVAPPTEQFRHILRVREFWWLWLADMQSLVRTCPTSPSLRMSADFAKWSE